MSKVNDIKNMKRQHKRISPAQALAAEIEKEDSKEENNVYSKEENKKASRTMERKRVSFDLRTDLHKELKMQSLIQEKHIYILVEEALEKYLREG